MTEYIITYGKRATDVIKLTLVDITNATEVYGAALEATGSHKLAFAILEAVDDGKYSVASVYTDAA